MGRFSKLETQSKARVDAPPDAQPEAPAEPLGRQIVSPFLDREEPTYDTAGYMRQADEAYFGGDEKKAMRLYSRAMQSGPDCMEAWTAQIRILIVSGQLSDGKTWLKRAFSVFPDAPQLVSLRALLNARRGMMREAIGASDMAVEKSPDDIGCWLSRGHILLIAGGRSGGNAEFCFQQCMQLSDGTDWKTPFHIGIIHDAERQWWKSPAYYEEAAARRTTLPYAWYRMGLALAEIGRSEAAGKALRRAEQLCDDNDRLLRRVRSAGTGSIKGRIKHLFRFRRK